MKCRLLPTEAVRCECDRYMHAAQWQWRADCLRLAAIVCRSSVCYSMVVSVIVLALHKSAFVEFICSAEGCL